MPQTTTLQSSLHANLQPVDGFIDRLLAQAFQLKFALAPLAVTVLSLKEALYTNALSHALHPKFRLIQHS